MYSSGSIVLAGVLAQHIILKFTLGVTRKKRDSANIIVLYLFQINNKVNANTNDKQVQTRKKNPAKIQISEK